MADIRNFLPSSLNICGHTYKIVVMSREDADPPSKGSREATEAIGRKWTHYGSAYLDPGQQEIHVLDELKRTMAAETTLHEVIHVLIELYGIRGLIKRGQEEAIVQALGNGITNVMQKNPSLRRMFGK